MFKKLFFYSFLIIILSHCVNNQQRPTIKFVQQSAPNGISLRGSCAVDENVVWFSGAKGSFVKTIDGGASWAWDSIVGASNLDFRDVHAFNDQEAVVLSAGFPAKIFKTTNGGKNWTEMYSDTTQGVFFNSMDFWDSKNGVAVSDPLPDGFLLIKTNDGGESWKRITPENIPQPVAGEAQFAASGTCICTFGAEDVCFVTGGATARVFLSNDQGKSWNVVNSPIMSGSASKGIFSVCFDNSGQGIIIGGDYKEASLNKKTTAYTVDGGKSWEPSLSPPLSGFNSCVAFIPESSSKYAIATGTEGTNLTLDGGKSWTMIDSTSFNTLVFEPKGKYAWAAGSDGGITKIIVGKQ